MPTQPSITSRVLPAVALTSALFLATPHVAFGLEPSEADTAGSLAQSAISAGLSENSAGAESLAELVENVPESTETIAQADGFSTAERGLIDSPDQAAEDDGAVLPESEYSEEKAVGTSDAFLLAAGQSQVTQLSTEAADITLGAATSSAQGKAEDVTPHVDVNNQTFVLDSAVAGRGTMDVQGGSKSSGTNVQLYLSNGTAAQRWRFVEAGTYRGYTYYTIYSGTASNMVLDVAGARVANGTNVQQYQSNGTNAQKWRVYWIDEAAGLAVLRSRLDDDYVLDVSGAGIANGTNLQLYKYNATNAQKWYLVNTKTAHAGLSSSSDLGVASSPFTAGSYRIQSSAPNKKVLDVAGASTKVGATVQVYGSNGTIAQGFYLTTEKANGTTYYRLRNDGSVLSVAVEAGDIVAGGAITQQATKTGDLSQLWSLVSAGSGKYYLVNAKTHHVLSNAGSSLVTAYAKKGDASQQWTIGSFMPSVTAGVYRMDSGVGNNQTLGLASDSLSTVNVQNNAWSDGLTQRWYIERSGSGYTLRDVGTGLYLSYDKGSNIVQSATKTVWGMVYTIDATDTVGGYRLVGGSSGMVADVVGASTKSGTNVRLYASNNTKAQIWRLSSVSALPAEGWYEFAVAASSGYRLDVAGASGSDGANVQIYTSNGSDAQKWHVTLRADGNYRIVSGVSNRALSTASDGTNVIQTTTKSYTDQAWRISYGSNGFVFTNVSSGKALDVSGGVFSNSRNVQVYQSNGTAAQGWTLRPTSPSKLGSALQKFTDEMMRIAKDNSHGYDQAYRWGERGDYDCSSLVITCLKRAGFSTGTATYTGNMRGNLMARGWQVLTYTNVNALQKGDILLNDYTHTAAMYSNTIEVAARGGNEFGGVVGGKPGDQTGEEIAPRNISYYRSGGGTHGEWWYVVLRATSSVKV